MKRLWHWLNHAHTWKLIGKGPLWNHKKETVGTYYVLQCTTCGNIKEVQV